MTEKIEPALSAEEWRDYLSSVERYGGPFLMPYKEEIGDDDEECRRLIALNNVALPDSDPRKITREKLALLRQTAEFQRADYPSDMEGHSEANDALAFVDALESYLRPEEG